MDILPYLWKQNEIEDTNKLPAILLKAIPPSKIEGAGGADVPQALFYSKKREKCAADYYTGELGGAMGI